MKTLTDRQERFVHEYIIDQNASAAAARAGYARNSRATQAARLMDDPLVRDRIIAELADLYGRLKLNAVEVLQRQVRAAYLDPARLFDAQQEAIPLHQLDEETRDGLTVNYSRRTNGDQVMRVRQTPRHIALAVLQKRLDAFAKLQEEAFAASLEREEHEAQAAREQEAALRTRPKSFFNLTFDLPADAPRAVAAASAHEEATPAAVQVTAPLPKAHQRATEPAPAKAAASAKAAKPASASVTPPVPASATSPGPASVAPSAPASVGAPDIDPDAPPSPHDPNYDFRKDPNAAYGGRWTAWNKYQREKQQKEMQAAEEAAAARLGAPPNMRVGPGRVVAQRMEPGYNPPWLRRERPRFAIGAGEFYFSGEEPD